MFLYVFAALLLLDVSIEGAPKTREICQDKGSATFCNELLSKGDCEKDPVAQELCMATCFLCPGMDKLLGVY
ncbi:hypothetical protein OESDEN_08210 [Oesophagostomum dentatum]|uniref:ShKT domain-containing protein n=1 Tax=Oesophagostomum dentatum TaxID=61180 RepID=A0A0B1T6Y7_OESDE|nr:hypothetical protein OESDEN_08210 [Oesophagostomum dentatum]